ncbi:DUF5302 domain-containing protein [Actinomadura kijaniata]|uniref:DUF5302 domain-containing protein n=1 Tax=Actinomadura kijaniata TaxID=46161 RepID=UPI0031DC6D83
MADSPEAHEGSEDDVKRKFREALERKRDATSEKHGEGAGRNGSKVRGAHSVAGTFGRRPRRVRPPVSPCRASRRRWPRSSAPAPPRSWGPAGSP